MCYSIKFSREAEADVLQLQKHAPQTLKKLAALLEELREHPRTGTGQVEQLKGYERETWSRRLNREHRLVYEIRDEEVLVLVVSTFGHYQK